MKKLPLILIVSAALTLGACRSDDRKSILPENQGASTPTTNVPTTTPPKVPTPTTPTNTTPSTPKVKTPTAAKPIPTNPTTGGGSAGNSGNNGGGNTGNTGANPPPPPKVKTLSNPNLNAVYADKKKGNFTIGVVHEKNATSSYVGDQKRYNSDLQGKTQTSTYNGGKVFNMDYNDNNGTQSYHKGLSYSDFGVIVETNKNLPSNSTASREYKPNTYAMGQLTRTEKMPTSGKVHYDGDAVVSASRAQKTLFANFSADVDFGAKTFKGKVHNFQVASNGVMKAIDDFSDINLEGEVNNTDYIKENGFSGNGFRGQFYGPNADEIGGVFDGNNSNYGPYEGAFGAVKQ